MDELKEIKKLYGEDMMHLCRELFPSLLEKPGLLLSILKNNIAPTRFIAKDIIENDMIELFEEYIYSFVKNKKQKKVVTDKTPFELMDEAGYKLYECKTEDDIQSFKKYYAPDEVLCTIYMGGRLDRCHVFFAVKKNVAEIKRENFSKPQRQDEYGTSVISIQFARGENNTISIKNRYNHTVDNPDSTFSNNLENIIPGLTDSFEKYYHLNVKRSVDEEALYVLEEAGPYLQGDDDKWYRYIIEANGISYCENNIIIKDGEVIKDFANCPERYIFADNYIVDMKEKKVFSYENSNGDEFTGSIYRVGQIERIFVTKNDDGKTINIVYEDQKQVKIKINKNNNIVGYYNDYVKYICSCFLESNRYVAELSLPEVHIIGDDFLYHNVSMKSISLPSVEYVGRNFIRNNFLREVDLPALKEIDDNFLLGNNELKEISLPNVEKIGDNFLCYSEIKKIFLPNVKTIGDCFLRSNNNLEEISLPNVEEIGPRFLECDRSLKSFFAPKLKKIDGKNVTNIQDINGFVGIINNADDSTRSR